MPMAVTPDPAHRRRSSGCADKVQYKNRKSALAVIAQIEAEGKAAKGAMNAYHCEAHHCWHVGHLDPTAKSERTAQPSKFSGRRKGKSKVRRRR